MPRGRTFDPAKRAQIRPLHDSGMSLTAIAAKLGTSPATISKYATLDGIPFDRSMTVKATAAHKVDLAAMRADLAHGLLTDAAWFREQARLPGQRMTVQGVLVDLSRPEAGDARNWMTSLGIAVQRSMELEKFDSDRGVGDAVSVLDSLSAALKTAADVLDS